MSRFEDELKHALQRKEAPVGFAERVLARVATPAPKASPWGMWRWAAAAALAVMLVAVALQYREGQRLRAQGELAKAQVMTALQITADKLEFAREKVARRTSGGERP